MRAEKPVLVLIWIGAVFVSILIHELGHAFAIRKFGGRCWITLYSFGGLASSDGAGRTSKQQILISAAGPAAGFLFAGVILVLIRLLGNEIAFEPWSIVPVSISPFQNLNLQFLVGQLLWINFAWGFLNLLPLYPLDGGQISRELFIQKNPSRGIVQSLWLSVFTGSGLAVYGLVGFGSLFMALMFGYLAYSSYSTIQAYTGRGGPRGW